MHYKEGEKIQTGHEMHEDIKCPAGPCIQTLSNRSHFSVLQIKKNIDLIPIELQLNCLWCWLTLRMLS